MCSSGCLISCKACCHSGRQAVVIPPTGLASGSRLTGRDAAVLPHTLGSPVPRRVPSESWRIWGLGGELPDVPAPPQPGSGSHNKICPKMSQSAMKDAEERPPKKLLCCALH